VETDIEVARGVSAALFGNRYLAEVVDEIWRRNQVSSTLVTTRELARTLSLSDSTVRPVLLRLCAVGVLAPLPKPGSARSSQFYRVQPGQLWVSLGALVRDVLVSTQATSH
jgi:DNA-binding FadR family transcriptional regulator